MSDNNKRKPSDRYHGGKKKGKHYGTTDTGNNQAIPIGSKGILVTCDSEREKRAGDEVIPLVEEYYDKLRADPSNLASASGAGSTAGKDISAMIAAEVAELKDKSKHKFKYHNTGVRGTFFILFPEEDGPGPVEVVEAVLQSLRESKQLRTPHASRLLPVTHTCFAKLDDIKSMAAELIAGQFATGEDVEPIEFAVEYEHRATAEINRMDVINAFAEQVPKPHRVNLTAPTKGILVQISRNVCAAAMVSSYRHLCKFNLKTIVEVGADEQQQKLTAKLQEREKAQKQKVPAAASAAAGEVEVPAAAPADAAAEMEVPVTAPAAAAVPAAAAAEAEAPAAVPAAAAAAEVEAPAT